MLTTRGQLQAGETILVQGAGGGVSTALIPLAKTLGLRVWVTGRDEAKRQ
jgi:NADPH:quinone reductase-like Zn-dependent oxidoreductase